MYGPGQQERVFLFDDETGTMETLWYPEIDNGQIDLSLIGQAEPIQRAGSVEPCPRTGRWDVILADGSFVGSFPTRMEALWREVEALHSRLGHGESIRVRPSIPEELRNK